MGGNLINYPDDVGTPTANLLLIKIFLNSVISTPGAKFANADLSNFYLMTPLKRPEYAKLKLSDIPEEVIQEHNLREKATPDGWVYIMVIRGMYGLPQAGSLGHDLLEERLNQEGYFQSQIVPGFWKHKTRNIKFVLVVDDFGIKYLKREDLDHLIKSLEKYYEVTVDLDGKEYVKIELDWDYENREVHLSMIPYLQKALRQFDNVVPTKRVDSPYPHVEPKYGAKQQFAEYDTSDPVGKDFFLVGVAPNTTRRRFSSVGLILIPTSKRRCIHPPLHGRSPLFWLRLRGPYLLENTVECSQHSTSLH
eukprot:g1758.t1 g1758   contig11:8776-9696(+)